MPTSSYYIADYNPHWPQLFRYEKNTIITLLGVNPSQVEHIGSTAILGMGAKPIIDLILGIANVPKLDGRNKYIEMLQDIGYENRGTETVPGTVYLRKAHPQRFNLHLTKYEGDFWIEHLQFRDYLRFHEDVSQQYERLKRKLMTKLAPEPDRDAYNDGKATFINDVLEKASIGWGDR